MGNRNSTVTRVNPVIGHLLRADPTGQTWLPRLLRLPNDSRLPITETSCDYHIRECCFGENEKALAPPLALLSWLIRHPRNPISGGLSKDPAKARIRQEWIDGSTSRIREGLSLLSNNPFSVDWHVFEGPTRPDVFIETDRYIVVIEGKRTERSDTTSTKWMPCRHQMLRHIDCAWEIRGQKDVFGFFIVESVDGSNVPEQWNSYAKSTTAEVSVKLSLPHRGYEETLHISRAFIGVTTWQTVCDAFHDMGLHRGMLPDVIE